jgi:predicted MFS family arabinose efflux permease
MPRDLRLILAVQALRAFAYGFGSVLLGTSLAASGLTPGQVGLVFAAIIAGMAAGSMAVGRYADRIGRRRSYLALLAVMGLAGAVFAVTNSVWALVLAAVTGTLSTDPNESGPMTTLEQAMMAAAPLADRVRVFGRYNAVAYLAGAAGALLAAVPGALRDIWPAVPADQRWLLAYPVLAAGAALLALRLSAAVETPGAEAPARGVPAGAALVNGVSAQAEPAEAEPARSSRPPTIRISPLVRRLAALFALDAFAGGFIVQAFIVFWFGRAFGASAATMGAVFFVAGLLQAASSIMAGRLAGRIGLLPTMVFTHIPSNVLLCLIPFAGSLPVAIGLLLARSTLSQMDVPARQAYVVSVVAPGERTAAAAYTNSARYVVRPAGAALSGSVMGGIGLAAPFVLAGTLKIVYDLTLWASCRRIALRPD